ncbi:glycosyltransferase family 4 protein [Gordonia sp. NPDC003376]
MKILIVGINYAPEVTGIAPYVTNLAEGLYSAGHTVTVFTGLPHYPEWRVAEDYSHCDGALEVPHGVRVRRFRHFVPTGSSLKQRARMEWSFGRQAAGAYWGDPDLVVAVTPPLVSASLVVARARAEGVPVGVIVQDLYGLGMKETSSGTGISAGVATSFEAGVLKAADGVAVIHDHFRATLIDMGVAGERVSVIRNWSHLEQREPLSAAQIAEVRQRHGWSPDEHVVLHTGNMGLKQGLENVVEAARRADVRKLPLRFVLVGDGNRRADLESAAAGVERVQFIRPLDDSDFRDVLAAADVLLVNELPGVSNMAVPSKLTSYFTAGRPILAAVGADGLTAGEVARANAGVVIEPGDSDLLAVEALELARNPDLCAEFASKGPQYASAILGQDAAIAAYGRWCETLAPAASSQVAS